MIVMMSHGTVTLGIECKQRAILSRTFSCKCFMKIEIDFLYSGKLGHFFALALMEI